MRSGTAEHVDHRGWPSLTAPIAAVLDGVDPAVLPLDDVCGIRSSAVQSPIAGALGRRAAVAKSLGQQQLLAPLVQGAVTVPARD